MHRFLALLWNSAETSDDTAHLLLKRLRSNPKLYWQIAFDAPGALVLHASDAPTVLQNYELFDGCGVVLGKLYRRDTASLLSAETRLSQAETQQILGTGGRHLVDCYWGRYVAVIVASPSDKFLLRDPTGAQPCYYAELDGVTCAFSDFEDYLQLRPQLNIDWQHVGAYLHFSRVVSRATGFRQVTQLLAGECLRMTDRRIHRCFYWSPAKICAEPRLEEPRAAALQLRNAIQTSVHAWTRGYRSILLELSGGLDSSVILACLGTVPSGPAVICLNMYTEIPEGDERSYARKAAKRAGCELVETVFRPQKSLAGMLARETLISPTLVSLKSESEDFRAELATARRIEAVFTGRGGDQLFQRRRGNFIATEYVHRHGLGSDLLPIVLATARLTRNAVWPVLSAALKYRLRKQRPSPYALLKAPSFAHAHLADLVDDDHLHHPWVLEACDLPEGKAQQIFDMVDSQNYFFMGSCPYADVVPALISQPVLECTLRIPSYVLTHGGRERGLVRHAFAADVPGEILQRTTKGDVISFYQDLVRTNRPFLREFLLDGVLVKERLLEATAVETALAEQQLVRATQVVPLLLALRAEHWLRSVPQQDADALRPTA